METGPSGSRFHIVASREKLSEKAGFKISCSDCSSCTYGMKPENRSIAINHDTCDTGRKCIQVCPAGIFVQEKKKEPIGVAHPENCIVCGHCVSLPDRFAQAQRWVWIIWRKRPPGICRPHSTNWAGFIMTGKSSGGISKNPSSGTAREHSREIQ